MGIQWTLAARYLGGRRLRALLTTLAVVFGVIVIFGMNILVPTMMSAFQSTMMAASDHVDMTVSQKSGESFPAAVLETVRGTQGIRAAQGILGRQINLTTDFFDRDPKVPDRVTLLSLIGLDPEDARAMRSYPVREGRFLSREDGAAAVVSASLTEPLGLKLGDPLSLPTSRGVVRLTIVGIRSPRAVPGAEEVLVILSVAQDLLAAPGRLSGVEANYAVDGAEQREAVRGRLEASLGPSYSLETPSVAANMASTLQAARIAFTAVGALAMFMGAFIIFNTFRTVVTERRRDIGMLRAIGAGRGTVIGVLLVEGLLQGAAGTALGMVLGYLLAYAGLGLASPMLGEMVRVTLGAPQVSLENVLVSIVLGMGVTLAAGFFPALNAGRVTPMEVLRPAPREAAYRRALGIGALAGIALVALSLLALASGNLKALSAGSILFMIGLILVAPALVRPLALAFGALLALVFAREGTGTLAQGNMTRQPSRAAVTASTTMIALAVIVALSGMMTSILGSFTDIMRKSLGSDYIFLPPAIMVWQNNMGASGSLADSVRRIDGVGRVSTIRYAMGQADVKPTISKGAAAQSGMAVSILGIDPGDFQVVSFLAFSDGKAERAYAELGKGRSLIANPIMASSAGLKVGDIVPLLTPEGRLEYRIVGIAADLLNAKVATAFLSQDNLAADFHKTEDILIQVNLAKGADVKAADAAIKRAAEGYPQFTLLEGRAYFEELLALFRTAFSGLYVLFAFLALPSLMSTLNTLSISVLERTREIGMLRAVGSTRRQVRRTVLAEALLLASFGATFGLLSGLYLGYLLVRAMASMGFPVYNVFPWQGMLAALVIGLAFGALAAIVPSRRAAGLQIVEALRYE